MIGGIGFEVLSMVAYKSLKATGRKKGLLRNTVFTIDKRAFFTNFHIINILYICENSFHSHNFRKTTHTYKQCTDNHVADPQI